MDLQKVIHLGQDLGYTGEELRNFVTMTQEHEREERARQRGERTEQREHESRIKEREYNEREKQRLHELAMKAEDVRAEQVKLEVSRREYDSDRTLNRTMEGSNEKGHPMEVRTTDGKVFSDESTDSDDTFVSSISSILLLLRGNVDTPHIKKYKKHSSELTRRFVRTSFHVEFCDADIKHDCSTVEDYLEELLEFSLSNSNRKKTDNDTGKNLYDKVNVDDIIANFRKVPSIDWLFKHFNVDFDAWSEIDQDTMYHASNYARKLDTVSMEEKCKMTPDEFMKFWYERKALNFASSLNKAMKELDHSFKRKSTAFDLKHQLVKQLFGEIGALIDLKERHNGSTKSFTNVFIDKNAEQATAEEVEIIEVEITTQPDYIFVNDFQSVAFIPVEVYGPDKTCRSSPMRGSSSSSGCTLNCIASLNLTKNQRDHLKQKMQGQHVMQLIAALHDKVKKDERFYSRSDKLSEVGIFVVNEIVFLSKITTTAKYLDLLTHDILERKGMDYKRNIKSAREALGSSSSFITIEFTSWHINLKLVAQRNALIIFLAYMMHVTC